MAIRKLLLHGMGPFEDELIQFPEAPKANLAEVHVLTGPNGCGKTTILLAIASLFGASDLIVGRKRDESSIILGVGTDDDGAPHFCLHPQVLEPEKVTTILKHHDLRAHSWAGFFETYQGQARFAQRPPGSEPASSRRIVPLMRSLKKHQSHRSKDEKFQQITSAVFAYSGNRNLSSHRLKSIQEVENHPLQGALDFTTPPNAADLIQWIATNKAKAALEATNNNTEAADRYTNAVAKMEQALAQVIDAPIRFDLQTSPLHLRILVNQKGLELDVLPDGLKSIIGWLGDLIMRMDRLDWGNDLDIFGQEIILLLDEIDIHLHPSWQRRILPMIQSLFPNAQVFCSTHSPFVVNSVDNAWIHALELDGGNAAGKEPVLSQEGRSYASVLSEIFEVKQRFGPEIEKRLEAFYTLRAKILAGDTMVMEHFRQQAEELALVSPEVANIVTPELRQIARALAGKSR